MPDVITPVFRWLAAAWGWLVSHALAVGVVGSVVGVAAVVTVLLIMWAVYPRGRRRRLVATVRRVRGGGRG